ncbi:MAG: hypothetical protein WCX16_03980, partial [Candidatus Omnitrophota bacterium]
PDELEAFVRDQLNKSQVFESDYDPKRPGAASPLTKDTKGGIDFNSKNINVEIKGQAIDVALPDGITEENLMNAQGFVPVIINIVPVTNLYHLLGLAQEEDLEGEPKPMAQGNSNPPREIAEVKS